jgi:phosphocarrier protein NPr
MEICESSVRRIEVVMPSRFGFHLRVITQFVAAARKFRSNIRVRKGEMTSDGKNVLGLLVLAVAWKSKICIEAEGDDAEEAIETIGAFFKTEH